MSLFKQKEKCVGCGKATSDKNELDQPFCSTCETKKILQAEIAKRISKEPIRKCCACETEMAKITYPSFDTLVENREAYGEPEKGDLEFVIIDKCPNCRAIFLDNGELKKISKIIEENGESDCSSGFSTGLVVGLALN